MVSIQKTLPSSIALEKVLLAELPIIDSGTPNAASISSLVMFLICTYAASLGLAAVSTKSAPSSDEITPTEPARPMFP